MTYSKNSFTITHSVFVEKILKAKDANRGPMVLVANKSDLERKPFTSFLRDLDDREVTTQEGKELSQKLKIPFIEASAKKRLNVEESFLELVKQVQAYQAART